MSEEVAVLLEGRAQDILVRLCTLRLRLATCGVVNVR